MINALNAPVLQNRFAPLSMNLHIIFCILATVLFIIIYLRTKKLSNIFWLLICDATVILQWFGDKTTALGVGICEIVLFAFLVLELRKEKKNDEADAKKASLNAEGIGEVLDELKDIEKVVKSERKAIIKEEIDVIGEAFEDGNND